MYFHATLMLLTKIDLNTSVNLLSFKYFAQAHGPQGRYMPWIHSLLCDGIWGALRMKSWKKIKEMEMRYLL
jgi:hypothetical protein